MPPTQMDMMMDQNAADASAAMVAPRKPTILRGIEGVQKFQHSYAGPFSSFSIAASMHRGAQTVLRGGFKESPTFDINRGFSPAGMGDGVGIKHWMKPQNWGDFAKRESYGARQMATQFPRSYTRFDSTTIFNPEHQIGTWNPFQISTSIINPIGHHLPGMQGQDAVTQGSASMMSASSSMFRLGEAEQLSEKMASGVVGTIASANNPYAVALADSGYGADMSAQGAGYALLGANSGMLSSKAAGMYAGAKAGLAGGTVPTEVLDAARATSVGGGRFAETATWAQGIGKEVSEKGVMGYAARSGSFAAGDLAAGGGVKAAGILGDALPVIGEVSMVAQTFMLAKGAAHLLKKPIQAGIGLTEDGIKSFKGSIDKPVFGMGFRDTEATKTARARGVSAIQNSRLNARSWLGNEAGSLWQHFG